MLEYDSIDICIQYTIVPLKIQIKLGINLYVYGLVEDVVSNQHKVFKPTMSFVIASQESALRKDVHLAAM